MLCSVNSYLASFKISPDNINSIIAPSCKPSKIITSLLIQIHSRCYTKRPIHRVRCMYLNTSQYIIRTASHVEREMQHVLVACNPNVFVGMRCDYRDTAVSCWIRNGCCKQRETRYSTNEKVKTRCTELNAIDA